MSRMLSFEFLIRFFCYQRRSRVRTSYFLRFLNPISRMLSFEFLIWFLCYQGRSRLRTSYFSMFLNPISRMMSFEFLIGFLCCQRRIVPEDIIFLKFSKPNILHEVVVRARVRAHACTQFITMRIAWEHVRYLNFCDGFQCYQRIALEHFVCFRISKLYFSHAVSWFFYCILMLS